MTLCMSKNIEEYPIQVTLCRLKNIEEYPIQVTLYPLRSIARMDGGILSKSLPPDLNCHFFSTQILSTQICLHIDFEQKRHKLRKFSINC